MSSKHGQWSSDHPKCIAYINDQFAIIKVQGTVYSMSEFESQIDGIKWILLLSFIDIEIAVFLAGLKLAVEERGVDSWRDKFDWYFENILETLENIKTLET